MIVGVMWAKNEADLIHETIIDAMRHVDTLMIADDGSTDHTWDVIRRAHACWPDRIEHVQQKPSRRDPGQRNALLNEVRRRHGVEDTWVQVIEADIFILDTDVRAITRACSKIGISWQTLNAVRPVGTWDEVDTYPSWKMPIRELMPRAHRMEVMLYTFRPLPGLAYDHDTWRPWPQGFGRYVSAPLKTYEKRPDSPLLLHVGYRGPTHFYEKYKHMGPVHRKYRDWKLGSRDEVQATVPYFNGTWNRGFEASREGWKQWLASRT